MTIKAFVFDAYGTLYDVQSVAALTEAAFPDHGATITQIWRLKQLEYSWLHSLMRRYEDFGVVTRESLRYTLDIIGLQADTVTFDRVVEAYNHLTPYPDAAEALNTLGDFRLAILSNGSPNMLDALVRNSGFGKYFEAVISVDAKRVFKPDPGAYELVQERLGCDPKEVVFVSSNGFDVAGARSFGFKVARIERVPPVSLCQELHGPAPIGAAALFRALRSQTEALSFKPNAVIHSLSALHALATTLAD